MENEKSDRAQDAEKVVSFKKSKFSKALRYACYFARRLLITDKFLQA